MTLSGLIVPAGCAHGVMQLKNAVREQNIRNTACAGFVCVLHVHAKYTCII